MSFGGQDFIGSTERKSTVDNLKKTSKTAQKMNFLIKDFFSKCDQVRRKLRISLHLFLFFLFIYNLFYND